MVKIRSDLKEIAQLIGPGSSYNVLLDPGETVVRLPLSEVLGALPARMVKDVAVPELDVDVQVQQLFEQIERKHVWVEIGALVQDLPATLIHFIPEGDRSRQVELPFATVLRAVSGCFAA